MIRLFIVLLLFTSSAFSKDLIDLKLTEIKNNQLRAEILNFDKDNEHYEMLKDVKISGAIDVKNKDSVDIIWDKIVLKDKESVIEQPFASKVKIINNLENGDKFSAKGNYSHLVSAIEESLQEDQTTKKLSNSNSSSSYSNSSSYQGSYSTPYSSQRFFSDSLDSDYSYSSGDQITTIDGCSPYVDYELNKVFIQQRVLQDNQVIQSCHNSSTSFVLEKDYDLCPDVQNLDLQLNQIYFQYYYLDENNSKSEIGDCVLDESQSGSLEVTTNYDNCSNYIDLSLMKLYKQYQQYYKDSDGNQILLNDCQKDYENSFNLIEDFSKCAVKHYFDKGYSIAQKEIGYNDSNNEYQTVYECAEDENYKYEHISTTDGCSPVVVNNEVQLFTRKYITIDGIKDYISDCSLVDNISVEEEICSSNSFTHDFETGQSYYNKTYFYYDDYEKIIVSNCIKSEESFQHFEETSVCSSIDDDSTKQTTYYSKTYFEINGQREYIGECEAQSTPVSYEEVGYKWINEFTANMNSITVSNSGDNIYIGSLQGEEVPQSRCHSKYIDDGWATCINNQYNINNYSNSNKCTGWSSPSYNGVAIDMNYSDSSSVIFNNYVQSISSGAVCRNPCTWAPEIVGCPYCTSTGRYYCKTRRSRACENSNNTLYYQRCNNYQCPLSKIVKFPIYRRSDGTNYIDQTINLAVKYICGNSQVLNNQEIFY